MKFVCSFFGVLLIFALPSMKIYWTKLCIIFLGVKNSVCKSPIHHHWQVSITLLSSFFSRLFAHFGNAIIIKLKKKYEERPKNHYVDWQVSFLYFSFFLFFFSKIKIVMIKIQKYKKKAVMFHFTIICKVHDEPSCGFLIKIAFSFFYPRWRCEVE